MDCVTSQSLMLDYVRGAVAKGLVPRMASHLARCPRCRRVHDGFQALARQNTIVERLESPRKESQKQTLPRAA